MEAAVAWLVRLICRDAARWGWAKAKDVLVGSPLERSVARVTEVAVSAAVAVTLGPGAPPSAIERMKDILGEIWPRVSPFEQDPDLYRGAGFDSSLVARLRSVVAEAMRAATTPIMVFEGYEPTSSLASLAVELGVSIDEEEFVSSFLAAWQEQVRTAALTDPAIEPLSNQLDHQTTQALVVSAEAALGRKIDQAVQVLSEQIAAQGQGAELIRWFEFQIDPIDEAVEQAYDDYLAGFGEALRELSPTTAPNLVPRLRDLRRQGLSTRINAIALSRALERSSVNDRISSAVLSYAKAVQTFLNSSDPASVQTWYSDYIERFTDLLEGEDDPFDLSRYAITFSSDVSSEILASIRRTLGRVVDSDIPKAFERYRTAYFELRSTCGPQP